MSNLTLWQQICLAVGILGSISFVTALVTIGVSNYLQHLKAKRALKYNKSAAEQIEEQIRGLRK